MTQDAGRRSLGRGLSALLGSVPEDRGADGRVPRTIPIDLIHPSALQPRQHFGDDSLQALADSIRENGVLQPILVRPRAAAPGTFEIVAGERRWRAAQLARIHELPVVLRELGDREALELALVENLQRQDLTALEEAEGYRRLIEDFHYTQEEVAGQVGKSRSHIANMVRLLALPEPVKGLLIDGKLTAGHARAVLNAEDPTEIAATVAAKGLNVRQVERLVRAERRKKKTGSGRPEKSADLQALERKLTTELGLQTRIRSSGESGAIEVRYETPEQLDFVIARLYGSPPAG